jgi:hypothetical protein
MRFDPASEPIKLLETFSRSGRSSPRQSSCATFVEFGARAHVQQALANVLSAIGIRGYHEAGVNVGPWEERANRKLSRMITEQYSTNISAEPTSLRFNFGQPRIVKEIGASLHNIMIYRCHADDHVLRNEKVVNYYLLTYDEELKIGVEPTLELHINMWCPEESKSKYDRQSTRSLDRKSKLTRPAFRLHCFQTFIEIKSLERDRHPIIATIPRR